MPNSRTLFLLIAAACAGMILIALYMQHFMGLHPCYLCIVQRVFVIVTGCLALIAGLHNPAVPGTRLYACSVLISALAGAGFSIRQLWLQSLPEDLVPACGPPADYLFEVFSVSEALSMLLQGDGNCAEVQWSLLGISIPGWTLLAFVVLAATSAWILLGRKSAN